MARVQLRRTGAVRRRGGAMSAGLEQVESTQDIALVDLLDRVIAGGVVVTGDIVIGIAGVDLVYVGLRLVLASAHELEKSGGQAGAAQ
jgi:hypothetical protein